VSGPRDPSSPAEFPDRPPEPEFAENASILQQWTAALDSLDGNLESWRQTVAAGAPSHPFVPPGVSGPPPAELRSRAAAVLSATEEMEREVGERLASVGAALRVQMTTLPQPAESPVPTPQFLDQRA
jgi:hypothetical protein